MLRQPKIAYIIKTFPMLSETFILNEILGLEKLGIEIEIFSLRTPSGGPVHASVAEVNAKVTYVPRRLEHGTPPPLAGRILLAHLMLMLASPRQYLRTARFCRREHGDPWLKIFFQAVFIAHRLLEGGFHHLHAHFANMAASVAEVVHHLTGVPYSFTAHAKDIYLTDPKELKRKMEGAACVLTCTAYNQRYLAAIAPQLPAVHLAYHGVDITRFACTAPRSGISAEPLILSVGRLCEKKGFPFLIRACRILKDRGLQFQCRIVGSGELYSNLAALICELDVAACVSLCGRMVQDEVVPLYRAANVFVLPCLVTEDGDRDGIPNVLIEAMASGLPVISTRISGIPELVDDMVNGILVAERDIRAIADAIELLCVQPALARRLGEQGRTKVLGRFALEASARRVCELLLQAVEASRHPIRPSVRAVARVVGVGLPAHHTRGGDG
jgi:glycosyltransferase involved in cell wall biosynthesis